MDKTDLAKRMKENYEHRTKQKLTRRLPTIIRIDGKTFSTWTKGLNKPFDEGLIEDMMETTRFLCQNIQGAKCGYTQSDEISILLTDFDKLTSDAWFDYSVQKMTSIAASMATAKFNQLRRKRDLTRGGTWVMDSVHECINNIDNSSLAFFDARVFQIPEKEEVVNYFLWRQRDAEKNSISMLAQSLFSHGKPNSELHKKNSSDMQEMCFQKGHNWNDLHFSKKRGSFIVKNTYVNSKLVFPYREGQWCSDKNEQTELGDLWYQKDTQSTFYPDKRGRLLEWAERKLEKWEDWCDVPIKSIRTKWDNIETPMFGKDRDSIKKLF